VAKHLYDWLPLVLQYTEPYMSTEDIDSGTRWFSSVASELETSTFGLFCLTRDNLNSKWLHWEAGSISRVVDLSKVVPMLFGLRPSDLSGPLTQFQAATFEQGEVFRVLKSINNAAGEEALDEARLEKVFTLSWGQLASQLEKISVSNQANVHDSHATSDDISKVLEEILVLARRQSITQSMGFDHLARELAENTKELHLALGKTTLRKGTDIIVTRLLQKWSTFYNAWLTLFVILEAADPEILKIREMGLVVQAIGELRKSVAILNIRTRVAARERAKEREVLPVPPAQLTEAERGGTFERPPSEPDDEILHDDQ
jgi:hypothetical protein